MRANEYTLNSIAYGSASAPIQQALRTHVWSADGLDPTQWRTAGEEEGGGTSGTTGGILFRQEGLENIAVRKEYVDGELVKQEEILLE
jgi:hypothetical protein